MSVWEMRKIGELPKEMQMGMTYKVLEDSKKLSGREGYLAKEVYYLLNLVNPKIRFSPTQVYMNLYWLEKENLIVSKDVDSGPMKGKLMFSVVKNV